MEQIDPTDEVSLLDYWQVVWKRRRIILYISSASVALAVVVSLLMTPIYQAKASLLPVESSQGRFASVLGSLQSIPLVGGAVGGALGKTVTDKLVSILNSRSVAEEVIKNLNLTEEVFAQKWDREKKKWKTEKPPTLQDTVAVLQKGMVKVTDDRKGLIVIAVDYKDPGIAAAIANAYTAALQKFLNNNSISLAKRNRLFLEKQIEITRVDLRKAEEDLKGFQTKKKIVALDAQAEGAIRALAEMKAQVMGREVQLAVLRESATPSNPDVKRVEDELRELRRQLKSLEIGSNNPVNGNGSDGAHITLSEAPGVSLGYARLKREALIQQQIFQLLTEQYEMAKIEEAKDDITFQVIDPAIAPEKRIKPKRTLNVMVAGMVSLLVGVIIAFFLEYIENQKSKRLQLQN